jgi:DNA-binding PadR family transcriptional regulator
MSVRLGLLGLLLDEPSHGYALKLRYDDLLPGDRPVQPAQVYSTLNRLERDGLVTELHVDRDGGPDRRTLQVTPEGERELDRWLDEPVEPEPHLHTALFTKLVVALLRGRSTDELLDRQRTAHLSRIRELTGLRRSSSPATALLADYAIFHLEADLRWLDVSAARIDDVRDRLYRRPAGSRPNSGPR